MLRDSFRALIIRTGQNRLALRSLYYMWRAFPYPLRRLVTALFIITVLKEKKWLGVDRYREITPTAKLGSLAFWGVPEIDLKDYRLSIEGAVRQPLSLSFEELRRLASVSHQVTMDCVGGFRNNSVMAGVLFQELLEGPGISRKPGGPYFTAPTATTCP